MRYRKKPVIIQAFQHIDDMGDYTCAIPVWFTRAVVSGQIYVNEDNITMIKTLEGEMEISDKDYVIQGIKGEIYPCKPDIFELTYEVVKEGE